MPTGLRYLYEIQPLCLILGFGSRTDYVPALFILTPDIEDWILNIEYLQIR